jgi:DNA-directed RNA polymerase specialized sigma subunit
MNQGAGATPEQKMVAFEKIILSVKSGNWDAKTILAKEFTPLLTSLAEKRSTEIGVINNLIESGKKGLFKAAKKYKHKMHPEKFRIFALDFIEKEMDKTLKGGGGILSSIFG